MLKQKIYSEVVMSKETITLEVSKETAKMVAALTSYQREKIDTLFDIWLRGRSYDNNDNSVAELLSLMDETAKYAEKKGLTPEKMEGLFDKTPNGFQ
jgi:transcription elongation factor GreA-like protein